MKLILTFLPILLLLSSCSMQKPEPSAKIFFKTLPNTYLSKSSFEKLPRFQEENYGDILKNFINDCRTKKAQKLYGSLCKDAKSVSDAKSFFVHSFTPYRIYQKGQGLLTGYYEPELHASRERSERFKYPIYKTPKDLITVNLSTIYPELKHYRLRGRVEGNRLIPYDTRAQSREKKVDADVICYCDSQIERFFLEIQGSGRIKLEDNSTIFVGYDNQNGYKYRAIGKYLVKMKALELKDVSLQSIKSWLEAHPSQIDKVLNYNKSMVYFKEKKQGATGALGLQLHRLRSVAVDREYIPLGSMLYMDAEVADKNLSRAVFAQDTGGAIKGSVRADLFLGAGDKAEQIAGELKSQLKLWIFLPKTVKERSYE